MIDNVKDYCSKFIQLTELEKEAIEQNFKPVKIKRKDFLLKEGMVCDFVAFLHSGIIRHYHIKDGNEITCDITLSKFIGIIEIKQYKILCNIVIVLIPF